MPEDRCENSLRAFSFMDGFVFSLLFGYQQIDCAFGC